MSNERAAPVRPPGNALRSPWYPIPRVGRKAHRERGRGDPRVHGREGRAVVRLPATTAAPHGGAQSMRTVGSEDPADPVGHAVARPCLTRCCAARAAGRARSKTCESSALALSGLPMPRRVLSRRCDSTRRVAARWEQSDDNRISCHARDADGPFRSPRLLAQRSGLFHLRTPICSAKIRCGCLCAGAVPRQCVDRKQK